MAMFSKGSMKGFAQVEPEGGAFELIPDGEYNIQAVKTDIKNTKSGNGVYVEVWFKVSDGKFKGRQIIKRFNWENQNADAERIGRQQLRGFALACGIPGEFQDSDELLNIPVKAQVFTEKGRGGFADQNGIKNFKAIRRDAAPVKEAQKPLPISARSTTAASFADEFAPKDTGTAPNWDF